MAAVVTPTATTQPFQLDMFAAGAEQSELPALLHSSRSSRLSIGRLAKDSCGIVDTTSTQANCANAEAGPN